MILIPQENGGPEETLGARWGTAGQDRKKGVTAAGFGRLIWDREYMTEAGGKRPRAGTFGDGPGVRETPPVISPGGQGVLPGRCTPPLKKSPLLMG